MSKSFIRSILGGVVIAAAACGNLQAQVIDYRIAYNQATNLYEIYGRATANLTNINLGGSQIGVVFPAAVANATFAVVSGTGGTWADGTPVYAPAAQPGSDFHAISTTGTTFSMTANTEVLFFTMNIGGPCVAGVRMYINGVDPGPLDPGMGGADFGTFLEDAVSSNIYTGVPYSNGGTICSPLAAQLLDFSGRRAGSDIVLNWSVADEQDLSQYRLLKSTDAKSWSLLTKVAPAAGAGGMATHTYTDAGAGRDAVVYYRLQLRDHHGVNRYSETLRFSTAGKEGGFSLIPNPVRSGKDFILQKDAHGNGQLTVLSSTGQVIARNAFRQDERISISTRGWAPGTYLVRWEGDEGDKYVSRLSVE